MVTKATNALLASCSDALVPLRLAFFEEVGKKLCKLLRQFWTDSPMVPFLVDTIEKILRDICGKFILSDVMS